MSCGGMECVMASDRCIGGGQGIAMIVEALNN